MQWTQHTALAQMGWLRQLESSYFLYCSAGNFFLHSVFVIVIAFGCRFFFNSSGGGLWAHRRQTGGERTGLHGRVLFVKP